MPKRLVSRLTDRRGPEAAGRHVGLKAGLAVALVGLGVAAFFEPTRVSVPSVRLAGAIMLAAGLFQATLAMLAHREDPLARGLGIGVLYTGLGGLFLMAPHLSITTLSLVLAVAQVVVGLDRGLAAWRDRPSHWTWIVALGVLLVCSGTSIALGWPASGLKAIGRFVGINLVMEGVTWLAILRRLHAEPPPPRVTLAHVETPGEPVHHERR